MKLKGKFDIITKVINTFAIIKNTWILLIFQHILEIYMIFFYTIYFYNSY